MLRDDVMQDGAINIIDYASPTAKTWRIGTLVYTRRTLLLLFAWLLAGDFCFTVMEQIIPCLVPLAVKGVTYRPIGAGPLLARNLAIYGLGGLIAPFAGIKLIDLAVTGLGLA